MAARWWGDGEMPSIEERVAYLEGRFGDHERATDDLRTGLLAGLREVRSDIEGLKIETSTLREEMNGLRGEMEAFRTEIRGEMGAFRAEMREEMDAFRAEMRGEMNSFRIGMRGDMNELRGEMNRRFEVMDQKIDRHFTWLVGIQVAGLTTVVGTVVASLFK